MPLACEGTGEREEALPWFVLVYMMPAGKAFAVGGNSMLCTANYEGIIIPANRDPRSHCVRAARKFGVRAAMPGFVAKQVQLRKLMAVAPHPCCA